MRVRDVVAVLVVAVLGSAVVCQFLQGTDPTFPLWYFTVDSAILTGLAALASLARPDSDAVGALRGAGTTGVLLSGAIFTTVIAPNTPTGTWFQPWDDPWVRAATVLFHAVGPVVAIAHFLTRPASPAPFWHVVTRWCAWPAAYLAVMLALQAVGAATIPYAFLQPEQMGGVLPVVGVCWALLVIFAGAGGALLLTHRRMARRVLHEA